jgi:hypothetical protein
MPPRTTNRSGAGLLVWRGIRMGVPGRTSHLGEMIRSSAVPQSSSAVEWGVFWVFLATNSLRIRWNRSNRLKTSDATS